MDMSLSKLQEVVLDREAWYAVIHEVTKSRTWLSDWTELILMLMELSYVFLVDIKSQKIINSQALLEDTMLNI